MDAIRAFIAIELPTDIQDKLGKVLSALETRAPKVVRWVPPNNIHLTLKFLGNVSPGNLNNLVDVMKCEALRHQPNRFCVAGCGAFPNRARPRVIWVGVNGTRELDNLQHAIDRETARLGYPSEERKFSPHLTLGRVSQHANPTEVRQVGDALSGLSVGELGHVSVSAIMLYRSDLKPGGAIYTPLASAPLGA